MFSAKAKGIVLVSRKQVAPPPLPPVVQEVVVQTVSVATVEPPVDVVVEEPPVAIAVAEPVVVEETPVVVEEPPVVVEETPVVVETEQEVEVEVAELD